MLKNLRSSVLLLGSSAGAALRRLADSVINRRYVAQTRIAERLRQFRMQAVVAICAVACMYVVGAFMADMLVGVDPKASHDSILRHRLSSPVASSGIVIVDIDERTLARFAPEHGRWPWPRDVLANALDKIQEAGAKAVLFNVLMSDSDKDHPEADATMGFSAGMAANTAFPMVRLAAENDALSTIKVSAISGARWAAGAANGATVALIVPVFEEMQARLGVVNQRPDADGIVRSYPVWWVEAGYALPSAVLQTLRAGALAPQRYPDRIALNWRNKQGSYTRISLADLMSKDEATAKQAARALRNAVVIVGASAPGIGQVKATPVAPVTDDNEILATAFDDLLHGTYLRIVPAWIILILTLASIVSIGALALANARSDTLNKAFLAAQAAMSGITLLCASYTNYLIDLSEPISLLLLIFSAIKLVGLLEQKNFRGHPNFFDLRRDVYQGNVHIVGFSPAMLPARDVQRVLKGLEQCYGIRNVLRIDKLFGQEHLLRDVCWDYECLLIFDEHEKPDLLRECLARLHPALPARWHIQTHRFEAGTVVRSNEFSARLMLWIIASASAVISSRLGPGKENFAAGVPARVDQDSSSSGCV